MASHFVKTAGHGPVRLDQEAAGLRWLAKAENCGGVRIVRVMSASRQRLELARIDEIAPSRELARRFGVALARTHAAGASWFGCPPDGWPGGATSGNSRQPQVLDPAEASASWGRFYAESRVGTFVRRLRDAGQITVGETALYDRLCARLCAGDFDAPQPALVAGPVARVHGDLWAGNVLWSGGPTGATLIDPLAHGDHAESDLGMLCLFGLAHRKDVLAAYDETSPLADGWRERIALHELSPLLFHAVLFGGDYGAQALEVAQHFA